MRVLNIKHQTIAGSLVQDSYSDLGYVKAHHGSLP